METIGLNETKPWDGGTMKRDMAGASRLGRIVLRGFGAFLIALFSALGLVAASMHSNSTRPVAVAAPTHKPSATLPATRQKKKPLHPAVVKATR